MGEKGLTFTCSTKSRFWWIKCRINRNFLKSQFGKHHRILIIAGKKHQEVLKLAHEGIRNWYLQYLPGMCIDYKGTTPAVRHHHMSPRHVTATARPPQTATTAQWQMPDKPTLRSVWQILHKCQDYESQRELGSCPIRAGRGTVTGWSPAVWDPDLTLSPSKGQPAARLPQGRPGVAGWTMHDETTQTSRSHALICNVFVRPKLFQNKEIMLSWIVSSLNKNTQKVLAMSRNRIPNPDKNTSKWSCLLRIIFSETAHKITTGRVYVHTQFILVAHWMQNCSFLKT